MLRKAMMYRLKGWGTINMIAVRSICKQTNSSQNSTGMNQLSPSGWLALKASKGGGKRYPLTSTCSAVCRFVRYKDPAQCWRKVGAQQM